MKITDLFEEFTIIVHLLDKNKRELSLTTLDYVL